MRFAAVILGGSKPLVVDFISSMALLLGDEPSVLIPTLWAKIVATKSKQKINTKVFFMVYGFNFYEYKGTIL